MAFEQERDTALFRRSPEESTPKVTAVKKERNARGRTDLRWEIGAKSYG
jgi:hypothetical protein